MRSVTRKYTVMESGPLPWIAWGRRDSNKSVMVAVDGVATYKLEHTLNELRRDTGFEPTVVDDDQVTDKTGTELFRTDAVLSGTRVNVTAVTPGAVITVTHADIP